LSFVLKSLDFDSFCITIIRLGFPLPYVLSVLVVGIEGILGVLLIVDIWPRATKVAAGVAITVFSIVSAAFWQRLSDSCGCFGSIEVLNRGWPHVTILLAMSLLLFAAMRGDVKVGKSSEKR